MKNKTFKIKTKETPERTRARLFNEIVKHLPDNWGDMVELAEQAEVSPQTLWNWAYGETFNPQLNTLTKVAKALGYTIELVKYRHLTLVKG